VPSGRNRFAIAIHPALPHDLEHGDLQIRPTGEIGFPYRSGGRRWPAPGRGPAETRLMATLLKAKRNHGAISDTKVLRLPVAPSCRCNTGFGPIAELDGE
jgi:hypothetical protein